MHRRRSRTRRRWTGWALGTLAALLLGAGAAAPPAAAATGPTVVSITFDNQWANTMTAAQSLRNHGMAGTFYVISGWIGQPGFLSLGDLQTIASWGNEIGGKTVNNAHLPTTPDDEAVREICQGRNNLMAQGFQVTNFAYPHAEFGPAHEQMVRDCGFNSGRGVGELVEPIPGPEACAFPDCSYAESIPPADPYSIRTPSDGEVTTTLAEMQAQVTNAVNNGGGLLAFSFHHVCDVGTSGCDPVYSVSPQLFDDFLTWLQTQAVNNVSVKTMAQVIGGPVLPAVAAPSPAPAPIGTQALKNPTLTAADPFAAGQPDCFTSTGFGTNTRTLTWTATGGDGGGGQARLQMSNYSSGDAKLVPRFDLGHCAPSTTTGHTYRTGLSYISDAPVVFTLYTRNAAGTWAYWTGSQAFPASSTWRRATFLSPAVPAGTTAMSFGMTLNGNGTVRTSNYSLVDIGNGPPPAAPVGVNALQNPTLTLADGSGNPYCWSPAGYGANQPAFTWTPTGGQTGGRSRITMTNWSSGDAKLVPTMDNGNCAPTATAGNRYQVTVRYTSTRPVFITMYSRDTAGNWGYWTQSPTFAAQGQWTTATFLTPVVPAGVNGLSLGMTIDGNGTLNTSNYTLVNTGATS